ncbi:hypothetical protein HQ571_02345 [Candidatus Kuenenbacteria bacterium]|nr:hypothetical protein [Candidatus Kuenenbacteria bacterium]
MTIIQRIQKRRFQRRVTWVKQNVLARWWWVVLLFAALMVVRGIHVHGQLQPITEQFASVAKYCHPHGKGLDCQGKADKVTKMRDDRLAMNKCVVLGTWQMIQANGGGKAKAYTLTIPICAPF